MKTALEIAMDIRPLITRIQSGDGDNAEVLRALGWKFTKLSGQGRAPGSKEWMASNCLPKPLTSVDDALPLVPEGWHTTHTYEDSRDGKWWWQISSKTTGQGVSGRAPTAARALVCAILRTKENTDV